MCRSSPSIIPIPHLVIPANDDYSVPGISSFVLQRTSNLSIPYKPTLGYLSLWRNSCSKLVYIDSVGLAMAFAILDRYPTSSMLGN